jgi:hypothetical protein
VSDQSSIHNNFEPPSALALVHCSPVSSFAGLVPLASGAAISYQSPAINSPAASLTEGTRYAADGRCVDFKLWRREVTVPGSVDSVTQQLRQATLSSAIPGLSDITQRYQPTGFIRTPPMAPLPGLGAVPANPSSASNPYGAIGQRVAPGRGVSVGAQQQISTTSGARSPLLLISTNY